MLINIMQAVFLAVLLMFPFKSDISNYVQSYQMKNACAVADSAIVKYYIHNSVLPEELDSQFLEKMGLEADAAEDMSYEKLEERKFSLSYEDLASKEIRYSIHSNVLLPQNMDLNFGEVKEKYYPIQVEESDHQTVTVKVTYPDGSIITLHEGHKFEVPANSHFEVTVVPDEGWTAGIPNVTDGSVIKDLVINVSAAQVKNYTLTVENCVNQNVLIKVEDINNGKTFNISQNQSVHVGYGTKFSLLSITPIAGYKVGSITPSNGLVNSSTVIKVVDAVKNNDCTITVDNVKNQIITCYIYDSNQKDRLITLTNGDSYTVGYNSRYEVKIEPFKDFTAGTLNVSFKGNVTTDMTITATPAVKEELPAPPEEDIGDGWVPIRPIIFDPGTPIHGQPLGDHLWLDYKSGQGCNWSKEWSTYYSNFNMLIKTPKDISKVVFGFLGISTPEDCVTLEVKHPSYAPYDGVPRAQHCNTLFGYKSGYRGFYADRGPNGPEQKNFEYFGANWKKYFSSLPGEFAKLSYQMYGMVELKPDTYYIVEIHCPEWQLDYCGFYYNRKYQHLEAPVVDLLDDVPDYQKP